MSMSQDYKYISTYLPNKAAMEDDWVLIFIEKKLLMRKSSEKLVIPKLNELEGMIDFNEKFEYIGKYDDHDCYCKKLSDKLISDNNFTLIEIREITDLTGDPGLFLLAGNANHVLHWYSMNLFCGCCGNKTISKKEERSITCPNCGNTIYPRISPATITAVFNGDNILLAHNRNFKNDLHSLIAGFVEPGETLEQCVEREIYEEVGLKVKNIKYFSSQPWPFPDSLMFAFTAEYESGEIKVDDCEITHAAWYTADHLPEIPSMDSVAGKMIRWYRDNYSKRKI
jgi:NAD+ diphosphatase